MMYVQQRVGTRIWIWTLETLNIRACVSLRQRKGLDCDRCEGWALRPSSLKAQSCTTAFHGSRIRLTVQMGSRRLCGQAVCDRKGNHKASLGAVEFDVAGGSMRQILWLEFVTRWIAPWLLVTSGALQAEPLSTALTLSFHARRHWSAHAELQVQFQRLG